VIASSRLGLRGGAASGERPATPPLKARCHECGTGETCRPPAHRAGQIEANSADHEGEQAGEDGGEEHPTNGPCNLHHDERGDAK
jgi:hypothetical protein